MIKKIGNVEDVPVLRGDLGGVRTHDPMVVTHVLSQLSYQITYSINELLTSILTRLLLKWKCFFEGLRMTREEGIIRNRRKIQTVISIEGKIMADTLKKQHLKDEAPVLPEKLDEDIPEEEAEAEDAEEIVAKRTGADVSPLSKTSATPIRDAAIARREHREQSKSFEEQVGRFFFKPNSGNRGAKIVIGVILIVVFTYYDIQMFQAGRTKDVAIITALLAASVAATLLQYFRKL